jgi:SAM-dependent methyltransferase
MLSSRSPFVKFLKDSGVALSCSEYFEDTEPGKLKNGVQCQDVQRLTFDEKAFDACTSSEVFEHVPNDRQGFAEIHRVLREDGVCVFTVPIDLENNTLERTRLNSEGDIEYLQTPEYHIDPIRENQPILAFRTYGMDILERLIEAGFERAEVRMPMHELPWSDPRPIVVAYKSIANRLFPEVDPKVFRRVLK